MSSKTKTTDLKEDDRPALVPKLRFPEFRGDGVWNEMPLDSLSKRLRRKVGSKELTPVSITAGFGFVDQTKKFGRRIAGEQYKNYIHIQRGDFVFNKGNSKTFPQGCIYQLKEFEEAAASTAFICFKLDANCVDHYFQSLFECNTHGRKLLKFITSGARSDGLLNINPTDFFSIELPLPPRKEEQQKIADCLGSLDDLITAQARKLDALKTHKKGLMQQLFPREGETQPRLRFPEFQGAEEWEVKTLHEIVEVASGQVDPTESPYCDLPHIGGKNIESHTGNLHAVKTARELRLISGKYLFDEEDILYSKIRPALNKVAVPNFKGVCSADIYPLRPSNDKLHRQYLAYLLLSAGFLAYAIKHSARGKIPKINRDALLAYEVVIPQPDEQQRIVSCLSSIDDLVTAQAQKLEALKAHKKGLMQQLFPSPEEVEA